MAELSDDRSVKELVGTRTLQILLFITRFIIFVFFAFQTMRHISRNRGQTSDKLSIVTFVGLCSSVLLFLIYSSIHTYMEIYVIEIKGDPIEEK